MPPQERWRGDGEGLLSAPVWTHVLRVQFVSPTTTSLLGWASTPDGLVRAITGDQHRMRPLQLSNTSLKAILTAST